MKKNYSFITLAFLFVFFISRSQHESLTMEFSEEDLKWDVGNQFIYDVVVIDSGNVLFWHECCNIFSDVSADGYFWDFSDSVASFQDTIVCVKNDGQEIEMLSSVSGIATYHNVGGDLSQSKFSGKNLLDGVSLDMCFPHGWEEPGCHIEDPFFFSDSTEFSDYRVFSWLAGDYVHNGDTVPCLVVAQTFTPESGGALGYSVLSFETNKYGRVAMVNSLTNELHRLKERDVSNSMSASFAAVNNELKAYPNPVNDVLTFDQVVESVQIFTVEGVQIFTGQNLSQVSFANYNKGLYIIKTEETNQRIVKL